MAEEVGKIVDGKVTGMIEYGAFVDIGEGKTGMVHISEIATAYVANIREHLTVGQEVRVKIMAVSPEGKISLSIKKASETPSDSTGHGAPLGERHPRPRRGSPNVWQGQRNNGEPQSFEDMMSRFKQTSEEKISTLRRSGDARYGTTSRRTGRK